MMTSLARRALVATALVLPLTLAACSGDGDASGASSSSPSVTQSETDDAESPSPEPSSDAPSTAAPAGDDVSEDFFARFEAGIATITSATSSMEVLLDGTQMMSAEGVVDYASTPPATQMTMSSPEFSGEIISIGGLAYMNLGEASNGMWLELPADAAAGMTEDPLAQMQQFRDVTISVTSTGTAEVNGAPADGFLLLADPAKMDTGDTEFDGAPEPFEYQIWLDSEGRPVKMVVEQKDENSEMSITTTLSNFDAPVSITAPPADQITSINSLSTAG